MSRGGACWFRWATNPSSARTRRSPGSPQTAGARAIASASCELVQITRFGGPEVLEVLDVPEPKAGPGQRLYDVSTAGVNYADTHHAP